MLKNRIEKKNLIINSLIDLQEEDGKGKGRYFISRFIEPGLAHYKELGDIVITKETLDKFIQSMVGCPVIIDHKDVTDKNVDKLRVGTISRVWFNEMDGWYYCEGVLTDDEAIDLVKNQGWNVSCSYSFVSEESQKTYHGKPIDMVFTDGEFLHLAIVEDPRYEGANIVVNKNDDDIEWITVKGNHIPIEKGQKKDEAVKEFLDGIQKPEAKEKTDKKNNYEELTDEKEKEWSDSLDLSQEEKNALYDYTTDLYNKINPLIERDLQGDDRFNEDFNNKLKNTVKLIDKSMSEIPQDISLIHLAYENDLKKLLNVEELDNSIINKTFEKKPYTSTAYSKESKFYKNMKDEKGRIELNIKAKKGTKAIPMEQFSFNKGEKEILLARNTKFKINNITEKNGKKTIECEVVTNDKLNNAQNSTDKENVIMQVLDELKNFILGVVNNEKEDEMKVKNEDKRKLIDEIGGILKDKVDDEIIRTVIKKAEELSYEPSEDDKADNKCKNEEEDKDEAENKCKNEDEEKEDKKDEEEKKEVKNSMKDLVMGGNGKVEEEKIYISRKERLEEGNKF